MMVTNQRSIYLSTILVSDISSYPCPVPFYFKNPWLGISAEAATTPFWPLWPLFPATLQSFMGSCCDSVVELLEEAFTYQPACILTYQYLDTMKDLLSRFMQTARDVPAKIDHLGFCRSKSKSNCHHPVLRIPPSDCLQVYKPPVIPRCQLPPELP